MKSVKTQGDGFMKYKRGADTALDAAYKASALHGMNVRHADNILFYRKMLHWEYVKCEEVKSVYRKIEEVISHTSCCAENIDIERLIITKNDGEVINVHVCDGERKVAERLYADLKEAWKNVAFGLPEEFV